MLQGIERAAYVEIRRIVDDELSVHVPDGFRRFRRVGYAQILTSVCGPPTRPRTSTIVQVPPYYGLALLQYCAMSLGRATTGSLCMFPSRAPVIEDMQKHKANVVALKERWRCCDCALQQYQIMATATAAAAARLWTRTADADVAGGNREKTHEGATLPSALQTRLDDFTETARNRQALGEFARLVLQRGVLDCRAEGMALRASTMTLQLRPYQEELLNKTMVRMQSMLGATMLCMPTGFGKTEAAIGLMRMLGRRAIFLVRTCDMVTQTAERVRRCFGAQTVPAAPARKKRGGNRSQHATSEPVDAAEDLFWVGTAMDGKRDIGCDILVSTVQGLLACAMPPDELATFGTVIFDEAHGMATEKYSQLLRALGGRRYICGLSATPEDRKDSFKYVPFMYFGYAYDAVQRVARELRLCVLRHVNPDFVAPTRRVFYRNAAGQVQEKKQISASALNQYWMECNARNERIAVHIARLAHMEKRIIFVYASVVALLVDVMERVRTILASQDDSAWLVDELALVHGDIKPELRPPLYAKRVVFLTYSMGRDGLDKVTLDTLVPISIEGQMKQPIGRILRELEGKKPLVVLTRDTASDLQGIFGSVMRYLRSSEFQLRRCLVHGHNTTNELCEADTRKCIFSGLAAPTKRKNRNESDNDQEDADADDSLAKRHHDHDDNASPDCEAFLASF